jgi:hypothetical protein
LQESVLLLNVLVCRNLCCSWLCLSAPAPVAPGWVWSTRACAFSGKVLSKGARAVLDVCGPQDPVLLVDVFGQQEPCCFWMCSSTGACAVPECVLSAGICATPGRVCLHEPVLLLVVSAWSTRACVRLLDKLYLQEPALLLIVFVCTSPCCSWLCLVYKSLCFFWISFVCRSLCCSLMCLSAGTCAAPDCVFLHQLLLLRCVWSTRACASSG